MDAGKLNRLVTLKRRALAARTRQGEQIASWAEYATVWAERRDLTGTQRVMAQQLTEQQMTNFTIRWREDVSVTDRVAESGREWEVTQVAEIENGVGLSLLCRMVAL